MTWGEPSGPRGGPSRQLAALQRTNRTEGEAGGGVTIGEVAGQRCVREQGEAKTEELGAVAGRVEAQHHRERSSELAQRAHAPEHGHRRSGDSGKQAAPGQHDTHAIRNADEFARQPFDGRASVEKVGEALMSGAPGELAQSRGVCVDPDEQALRLFPCLQVREAAVAGTEIDRDPAREAGEAVSASVIGALEALAADDVHE